MAGMDWLRVLPGLAAIAALAAVGAWLALRHALRHGLFDQPGERRSHSVATPRGGGIGIVVAWAVGCVVLWLAGMLAPPLAAASVAGLALVGGVGWIDDHRPLSPWWRLAAHVVAGSLLAAGLWGAGAPPWLVALAFAAVPVLVNAWNFMDGIDGLATSQAALASLGFALLAPTHVASLPALALVAACLGFLPFNFPRARIFLGDVGSGALGFTLAASASVALLEAGPVAGPGLLVPAFLLVSAFLIDTALTLARRIVRRERWWTPHVEHAYQRLAARLGSHAPVTLLYAAWTVGALLASLAVASRPASVKLSFAGGCVLTGILVWRRLAAGCSRTKECP